MYKRPSITINVISKNKEALKEILAGIEEEELYYEVSECFESFQMCAEALALKAAEASNLEVGIGVTEDEICVHVRKLRNYCSLFKFQLRNYDYRAYVEISRCVGINAARYVKGVPFK